MYTPCDCGVALKCQCDKFPDFCTISVSGVVEKNDPNDPFNKCQVCTFLNGTFIAPRIGIINGNPIYSSQNNPATIDVNLPCLNYTIFSSILKKIQLTACAGFQCVPGDTKKIMLIGASVLMHGTFDGFFPGVPNVVTLAGISGYYDPNFRGVFKDGCGDGLTMSLAPNTLNYFNFACGVGFSKACDVSGASVTTMFS